MDTAFCKRYVHALYYPSWRIYRNAKPSSMDCKKATHILYAFARVDVDGSVDHLDEAADLQMDVDGWKGCIKAFVNLRMDFPHLKFLISIGGGNGSKNFPIFSATEDGRRNFAASTLQFIERFEFDGVDVDWEHPSDLEQGRNYIRLLEILRAYLPKNLIFSALPAGEWCLRNINLQRAAKLLDHISLMCYDFAGSWSSASGHQSQLYAVNRHDAYTEASGDAAVQYIISQNVDPSKLIIGVPVYGRSFLGTTGPGQNFVPRSEDESVFEYKDLPRPGSIESLDLDLVAAFCSGADCGFVTYDTPATVSRKAQYVREQRLGGLFYWTGAADSDIDSRSLVTTGYQALFTN